MKKGSKNGSIYLMDTRIFGFYFGFSVLALKKGNNEIRSLMSWHKIQICINIL